MQDEVDGGLIAGVAAGDRAAFARLVERWRGPVFRYVRALLPSDAAAEDALQETFLAIYRGAAGYRAEGSARRWILGVARHNAARQRRRRAGEPSDPVPLDALGAEAGWGSGRSPEDLAAALEDQHRVQAALATLPEDDREILVLHDLEQLSGPEVADLLELSLAAVKSRVHRARLKLMARLVEVPRGVLG